MTSIAQDETAGSAGAITEQRTAGLLARQVEVDLHSREAFEMLGLGEAIVGLKGDLRTLRLEKEDLRFDRDRYRASAAQTQSKLSQALRELDQNRVSREELGQLRGEVVQLARDCEARVIHERDSMTEQVRNVTQAHHAELAALRAQHELEKTAMRDEFHDRLRQVVVSLAGECAAKIRNETPGA
ncbi:MAG: hypothetical protein ABW039_08820 [Sphingobium sp.]